MAGQAANPCRGQSDYQGGPLVKIGSCAPVGLHYSSTVEGAPNCTVNGFVTLSEIGSIWTINQQAKPLKTLASKLAVVGEFH
jgi:hypothetical protein